MDHRWASQMIVFNNKGDDLDDRYNSTDDWAPLVEHRKWIATEDLLEQCPIQHRVPSTQVRLQAPIFHYNTRSITRD